jgi:hypothetical protein
VRRDGGRLIEKLHPCRKITSLATGIPLDHIEKVKRITIIGYLLAIFVIVGLIAGTFIAPAAASQMNVASMADGGPCCPQKHAPDDCQKCPFGVHCVSPGVLGAVNGFSTPFFPRFAGGTTVFADHFEEGLGSSPPSRPPRILV